MHTFPDERGVRPLPGERHLGEILDALRAHAFVILAVAAGAALLAGAISLLMPKQYRASALVLVTGSKVPSATSAEAERPDSQLFVNTYATLLRSRLVATEVVRELKLAMAPERLARSIQVQPIPGTFLLRVSLDHPDRDAAVRIVNAQTARVVALNREISLADLTDTREYLQAQVADAARSLATREQRLADARASLQVESLQKGLAAALERRTTLETVRDERRLEAVRRAAEAQGYRTALGKQTKTLTLTRSLGEDTTAMPDLAARASGTPREELLTMQLRSEVLNPLHEAAEPLLAMAESQQQGAEAELKTITAQLAVLNQHVDNVQRQLADRLGKLQGAEREFELGKAAYEGFTKSFENARLSVAAQRAEIRVVEAATASAGAISPRPALNSIAAGLGMLLFAIFLVLISTYVRQDRAAADA